MIDWRGDVVRLGGTRGRGAALGFAMVGVAWTAIALIHPTTYVGEFNRTWLFVHVAQLALIPLVTLGVLTLLICRTGPAATVARAGVVIWAVGFAAYDAMGGIGIGILPAAVGIELGPGVMDHPIVVATGLVAPLAWLATASAATLALRGGPRLTQRALIVSTLIFIHAGLPAALGYAALAVAFWTGVPAGARPEPWRRLP